MALYSSFGSSIKSVQAGSIALTAQTSNTATITSVNTAKSFVMYNGESTSTGYPTIMLTLTNATTVTADATSSVTGTVRFTVVEFN